MNFDQYLADQVSKHVDPPPHYVECAGSCGCCYDPEDLRPYEDVANALDDVIEYPDVVTALLAYIMNEDEHMCSDCIKTLVADYTKGGNDEY